MMFDWSCAVGYVEVGDGMVLKLAGCDIVVGDTSWSRECIKNAHHTHQAFPFGLAVCLLTRGCCRSRIIICEVRIIATVVVVAGFSHVHSVLAGGIVHPILNNIALSLLF